MFYLHTNSLTGGHGGVKAMISEITPRWYWRGYDQDVKECVARCPCQYAKDEPDRKAGEFIVFPAKYPNDSLAIDHIGPLPVSNGKRYITTYYDRFSGYKESQLRRALMQSPPLRTS